MQDAPPVVALSLAQVSRLRGRPRRPGSAPPNLPVSSPYLAAKCAELGRSKSCLSSGAHVTVAASTRGHPRRQRSHMHPIRLTQMIPSPETSRTGISPTGAARAARTRSTAPGLELRMMRDAPAFGMIWCGTALAALAMGYTILASIALRVRARSGHRVSLPAPPVTILKPLCGAEPGLYERLRSFCEQSYPRHADRLRRARRGRSRRSTWCAGCSASFRDWICGSRSIDAARRQPKVSNLINMMPFARHDYLVMADSDVRVAPDYLRRVVAPLLDRGVGIVTCPYRGCPRRGTVVVAGVAVHQRVVHALGARGGPRRLALIRLRRNHRDAP